MKPLDPLTSSPKSLFTHYAFHTVIGMVAMSSAIIIDGLFVGRWLGSDAMAAISLVWPIIGFTFGFFYMIIIGGCAAIGNLMGAGKQDDANKLFTQVTLLVAGVALIGTAVGIFLSEPLTSFLRIPPELQHQATRYFSIVMIMIPFFGLSTLASYSSRLAGHPNVYGAVMSMSAGLNIALDALCIIVLGWGIEGAAFATGISQIGGVVIGIYYMRRKDFALQFAKPNLPLKALIKAIGNGVSEFFTEISYSVQALITNSILVGIYGATGVTSYVIIGYFFNFAAMAFFGFAEAAQPLMSQNNGAAQHKRVQHFLRLALISSVAVGAVSALIILLFHTPVAKIFVVSSDPNFATILQLTKEFVWLSWPVFIFMGLSICFSSYFTALEKGLVSATISTLRILVLPLLFLLILTKLFPAPWFLLAFSLSEGIAGLIGYLLWRRQQRAQQA